ncbi:MAG: DNA internalization-related competence protein ComEC/Rec2 [Gammaproteobacteria bacterium]|nr:DNA internalization-related competence protein ComEC/Rec2 [Gammaproteobacteria bacterium]
MIRACLLIVAGGYAAQHSRVPLSSDLCKLLLVASIAMLVCRRTRFPGYVLLGFTLFMQAGQGVVDDRLEAQFANDSLLTRVRVVDFPRATGNSVVMLVEPLDDRRLPPRSRLSWFEPPLQPSIGDVWELELRLKRPRGYSNPGVFDVEAWMFRQKIHASGYVVNGKRNRRLGTGTENTINAFRRQFVARASVATESRDASAVLAAVGVGARHLISSAQWDNYAMSGTSHLMAISGLHIGLAATFAFLLARALLGGLRTKSNVQIAAIGVGVLVAMLYAAVSGFGVPAQRASLMLLVAALAVVRRRPVDPFATVSVAAVAVFILDPVATMTPGFNLSFAAVVLLLWLARCRNSTAGGRRFIARAVNTVRQLFTMQVFLLLGLVPLTVILFDRVALLATPVNLVAVPLFSAVTVPLTLASLAIGDTFEQAGFAALQIAAESVDWLGALIEQVVRLPVADVTVAGVQGCAWLVVIMPALWAILPQAWPGRWVAPLAVAGLLLHAPQPPNQSCFDAHILDVGQGLATAVQTRRSTLLFDTGASYRGGGSVAERVIVPFLKSKAIKRIDHLVVSHADNDHSGGVRAVHEYAEIGATLVGETLRQSSLPTFPCVAGQHWEADGVHFRILHPHRDSPHEGNDSSCVLLISVGPHSLLLTGDIEAGAEREIIEKNGPLVADAVVVPHHGSSTSSGVPFVDAVSPLVAIVSAGYGNRWGFPKERVVMRWQAVGAEVLDTATSGAVSLRLCAAGGLRDLRRDRYERRRFWRDHGG